MGFGSNAFADEDNFNDASAKKSEAPAVRNLSVDPFHFGVHVGMGLGSYWDYPSKYFGSNDWLSVAADLGCVFNIRINRYLRVVPELNLGLVLISRDLGDEVSENRVAYGFKIPAAIRFTPTRQFYLETGVRMAFNFASSHTFSGSDFYGNSVSVSASEAGNSYVWEAKTFVPSLIFGLGGTFRENSHHDIDVGARFVLDVGGIEKYDDIYLTDGKQRMSVKNKAKVWNIQIVFNYYFGSPLSNF